MKNKLLCIFVCMLFFLTLIGTFSSADVRKKTLDSEPINPDYSHKILAEYFTMTTCVPCKYTHRALKELFANNTHPFYYITYVYNKNNISKQRKSELQIVGSPTVAMDSGFDKVVILYNASVKVWKEKLNESILDCGARTVKDIDISLDVEWLGAVNIYPEDGATTIPLDVVINWTVTEMVIDIEVTNNETSEYDGHIHIQVVENESSLWNDKFGKPYSHEFKNYAYNKDETINAGDTWSEAINWDGMDYDDSGGDNWNPHIFDYITQGNTWVIASVMDKDNNKWIDETEGFRAGIDTDPKTFDVYFGDTNPPPLIIHNGSATKFNPTGDLDWSTIYYLKIDVWNKKGERTPGEIYSFTTRGNSPPFKPTCVNPENGSIAPIDTILEWFSGDPDGDEVTYDVYFGEKEFGMEHPPQVASNISETTYDPTPLGQKLEFNREYFWKIVAWDEYGLNTSGDICYFKTEKNEPPNPAKDPIPKDGAKNVSVYAILYWNGTDPNSGDTLRYDVYFGPNPNPPLRSPNQDENYYDPDVMPLFLDFYWRIDTRDSQGEVTPGPNWTFATGINPPPTDPEIDGPTRGKKQIPYNFTFVSTDVDNQKIKYHVDWDDGNTNITDYLESGENVTLTHTWEENGKYVIKARAEDWYNEKSNISTHNIEIPRGRMVPKFPIFQKILERILETTPLLRYILGIY
jgi:hypothetical protein